jgi:NTP pyrophosphatase (non-canonical NTP hydrolase)
MNLNHFHSQNVRRQREAFAPPHSITALAACVQEEVGELAEAVEAARPVLAPLLLKVQAATGRMSAAILGVTGEKKRKAHLTNADVLDAVADAMTYLSLVAFAAGCDDLERLLADTFNMVSERAGSSITVEP